MRYLNEKEVLSILKPHLKYTLIGCSDMALTYRYEFEFLEVKSGDYAQYKNIAFLIIKPKGKKKLYEIRLKTDSLIFEGWNNPLKIDTDLNSFKGNALINFIGDIDLTKKELTKNLNSFCNKGIITIATETEPLKDLLLFPELIDQTVNLAVAKRMFNKGEIVKP